MEKNIVNSVDFTIVLTDDPIIFINEDDMYLELKKKSLRNKKIREFFDGFNHKFKNFSWAGGESGINPIEENKISVFVNQLGQMIKYLNENNVPWKGGVITFTEVDPIFEKGEDGDEDNSEKEEDNAYLFVPRIGFFKVTKSLIIISIMDQNGTVIKQEYPIHVKMDKL